jgi:hypothetical protein
MSKKRPAHTTPHGRVSRAYLGQRGSTRGRT